MESYRNKAALVKFEFLYSKSMIFVSLTNRGQFLSNDSIFSESTLTVSSLEKIAKVISVSISV